MKYLFLSLFVTVLTMFNIEVKCSETTFRMSQIKTANEKPYVDIKTDSATVRLSVYNDGIVRVQVFKGNDPEVRWEPSIVAQPKTNGYAFKESKKEAVLKTLKMRVVVNKTTAQILFFDSYGKLLTKTSKNGGRVFSKLPKGGVSQQFMLSKKEHIYGVGQYVSGLPYVNGTGCGLAQTNMEDAGQVLVSDRGYGMFWNNPSTGEFQSFGKQELLNDKNVKTEDGRPGFEPLIYNEDSNNKYEFEGKYAKGKLTNTINISSNVSAIDIMQSDFDLKALGKKITNEKGITLVYKGTIRAQNRTGWYYFNIGNSGRGVRFVLDNDILIENRIHHGFTWNSGRKWLEANKDYKYELYFSHGSANIDLSLYWNPTADIYKQYTWTSSCWKTIDYFVFAGTNTDEIMKGFYDVTGEVSILPKWSLGYIHCQAIPFHTKNVDGFPQEDFLTLVSNYRQKQIPCDVLVQDFMWWTVMGSHIFRPDAYSDSKAWLNKIQENNFKLMISVWPIYEKVAASGYKGTITAADLKNHIELEDKGLLIGNWVDYTKPEARKISWHQISKSLYNDSLKVDAFWLDADEGGEKDENFGNAYPLLNKMTFDEGARATISNKRIFLLGRSMYPGSQRYDAAMWSGDIGNDFYTLQQQVSAGLSVSTCGMPYWTTDIGGFGGGFARDPAYSNDKDVDSPTYRELVTRWFQYGMFCPIFRVHRADNNSAPWYYGEEGEKNITDVIKFRYRLMPYIYSLTKQTREHGRNPMRPLYMDFGYDKNTVDITQQFMYGPAFLVCPVTKGLYSPYKGKSIETSNIQNWNVYLPKGADWFDFNTGEKLKGGQNINTPAPIERMPLFVRAGSIVPMGKVIQSTQNEKQTELELRIYPGADADFTLYDDDGETYDYEKGEFTEIDLHWNDKSQTLTIGNRNGQFKSMPKELILKPIIVEKGKGVGSLIEYSGDVKINYSGAQIVWVKK